MAIRVPLCPHCPHSMVAPSRLRWYERPLLLVLIRPFRCRACARRFLGRFRFIDIPEFLERA